MKLSDFSSRASGYKIQTVWARILLQPSHSVTQSYPHLGFFIITVPISQYHGEGLNEGIYVKDQEQKPARGKHDKSVFSIS